MSARNLVKRLERLAGRVGYEEDRVMLSVVRVGQTFALFPERCRRILAESGFFVPGIRVLNYLHVPDGLTGKGLEKHLREHAEQICGLKEWT